MCVKPFIKDFSRRNLTPMLTTSGDEKVTKANRIIWRTFTKKHGITLQQDAVDFLLTKLVSDAGAEIDQVEQLIEYIASMYVKQENRPNLVSRDVLTNVVDGILKSAMNQIDYSQINPKDYVHVVSAFETSKWEYNPHSKQFLLYLKLL
jgi:hypothetical protein